MLRSTVDDRIPTASRVMPERIGANLNAARIVLAVLPDYRYPSLRDSQRLLRSSLGTTPVLQSLSFANRARIARSSVVVESPSSADGEEYGAAVDVVSSLNPQEGLAAGVRAATIWALRIAADGLVLVTTQRPLQTVQQLNELMAFSGRPRIVASYSEGDPALPALFPASAFGDLLALRGEEGPEKVLAEAERIALVTAPPQAFDVAPPADPFRLIA